MPVIATMAAAHSPPQPRMVITMASKRNHLVEFQGYSAKIYIKLALEKSLIRGSQSEQDEARQTIATLTQQALRHKHGKLEDFDGIEWGNFDLTKIDGFTALPHHDYQEDR